MAVEIECVVRAGNDLGEGPWWDAEGRALWWIDAWRGAFWCLHPATGSVQTRLLPPALAGEPLGSMVLDRAGRVVCALRRAVWRLDLDRAGAERIATLDADGPPTNRLNDGKCDRAGRFWCGSLNTDWTQRSGALYRLDPSGVATRCVEGHGVSNGLAFSPDDRWLYHADTMAHVVWRYPFALADGRLGMRELFIDLRASGGRVDGATVDSEGHYWCALFGGAAVARFDPQGRLVQRVALPVRDPTMCTFGGDGLQTLYVTTARRFLDDAGRAAQPLAGTLLAVHGLGVQGLAETRYAG